MVEGFAVVWVVGVERTQSRLKGFVRFRVAPTRSVSDVTAHCVPDSAPAVRSRPARRAPSATPTAAAPAGARTLTEATQHTVLLARAAYAVYDPLALQRARVRSIALRANALRPDDRATRQLNLDAGDDKPLATPASARRFGPAATLPQRRPR
jgi:hypothetical protein